MQSSVNARPWAWLVVLCALSFQAQAEEGGAARFSVLHADSTLVDGVYVLNAQVDYQLTDAMQQALQSGVTLTLQVEVEVLRERTLLWDDKLAGLTQRYELRYHALTRQYLMKNFNTAVQQAFPTRAAALSALGEIKDVPLLDEQLLTPGANYSARLRARLDTSNLPAPLRLAAFLSPEWRTASEWYTWPLQH